MGYKHSWISKSVCNSWRDANFSNQCTLLGTLSLVSKIDEFLKLLSFRSQIPSFSPLIASCCMYSKRSTNENQVAACVGSHYLRELSEIEFYNKLIRDLECTTNSPASDSNIDA